MFNSFRQRIRFHCPIAVRYLTSRLSSTKCLNRISVATIQSEVGRWESTFRAASISEPRESAEYILAHVLGFQTLGSVLEKHSLSTELTEEQQSTLDALCEDRLQRKPVQYVIGEWDFRGLTVTLRPPIFIPRPETEELVGHVLDDISTRPSKRLNVIEIGCGSGAICLSLLHEIPQLTITAIDCNLDACILTKENATRLGLHSRLHVANTCVGAHGKLVGVKQRRFDIVISNPPYIPEGRIPELEPEITKYEDRQALDGGVDGLDVIRNVIRFADLALKENGSLWLEVDGSHPPAVEQFVTTSCSNLHHHKALRDLNCIPRFCHIQKRGMATVAVDKMANVDLSGYDETQVKLMGEQLLIVNENDQVVGFDSKKNCHLVSGLDNHLHRAFSVFLFNSAGELLLQRRSDAKITFPGYWTNTCCSHPLNTPDELGEIGVKRAARRKLEHELGIPAKDINLSDIHYLTRIHYKANSDDKWGEHEIDYILVVQKDISVAANMNEVKDYCYVGRDELASFLAKAKAENVPVTPWFEMISQTFLMKWWKSLDALEEFVDYETIHKLEKS